ncbi:hypothetical protein TNCV_570321 [Trichonephila clavipes]|nr:hypothetical protein TNCV_570321 [Trichonephila clavipes]
MHVKILSQYPLTCGRGYPNWFCYCLKPVLTYHLRNFFNVFSGMGSLWTARAFVVFDTFPDFSEMSMSLKSLRSR